MHTEYTTPCWFWEAADQRWRFRGCAGLRSASFACMAWLALLCLLIPGRGRSAVDANKRVVHSFTVVVNIFRVNLSEEHHCSGATRANGIAGVLNPSWVAAYLRERRRQELIGREKRRS